MGRTVSLKLTLQVAGASESIVVNSAPMVDIVTSSSNTTLGEQTVANTPVLGRKFEDLLTLTPGVSIVQGPDGDEITINGQRGIFNNISLDGGDYNNGFFGEQSGGQRAAVDITLEAVREFQVVASGANAEFGRTGGGRSLSDDDPGPGPDRPRAPGDARSVPARHARGGGAHGRSAHARIRGAPVGQARDRADAAG